jgi:hypothetical protein
MSDIASKTHKQSMDKKKLTKAGPIDNPSRIALHGRDVSRLRQNKITKEVEHEKSLMDSGLATRAASSSSFPP